MNKFYQSHRRKIDRTLNIFEFVIYVLIGWILYHAAGTSIKGWSDETIQVFKELHTNEGVKVLTPVVLYASAVYFLPAYYVLLWLYRWSVKLAVKRAKKEWEKGAAAHVQKTAEA